VAVKVQVVPSLYEQEMMKQFLLEVRAIVRAGGHGSVECVFRDGLLMESHTKLRKRHNLSKA